MTAWRIENAGADALIIRFGDTIDPAQVPRIRAATDRLAQGLKGQVKDLVPSYTTLMVVYDPVQNDFDSLSRKITRLLDHLGQHQAEAGRLVEIPVWYDPEVGPDLERVAAHHQLSIDEIIRRHSECEYLVFAIGFAPGFAYMGHTPESIATPRLATPRERVPVGSVALADRQTAVYPIATPGGWNLLGRTAMTLFDRERETLCPLAAGDRVRFVPVGRAQFLEAGGVI